MNRPFNPTSRLIRTAFAAAAILATLLVAVSIEGLVDHYRGTGSGLASAQPVVMARR